jgi:hypothetical protein
MYCRKLMALACVCVLALVAGAANADIIGTYVDADQSNTTPGTAFSVTEDDYDNLWHVDASRSYCENGDVMVSNTATESSPSLTTTVTGLANGNYNVYAVYWRHSTDFWCIDAGLVGGATIVCDSDGTPTGNNTIDKMEYFKLLGQAQVTDGSFVVNVAEHAGGANRAWYDGVSYQRVVPEPSAVALVVMGALSLTAYAWRKRKQGVI